MTCKRCAINSAWLSVRNARTYETVVDRAYEWLQLFWPEARTMQLAPKSLRDVPCPPLYITSLAAGTAGQWDGRSIKIGVYHHRAEYAKEVRLINGEVHTPIRDELRGTILHEVQHAIDELSGGIARHEDPFVAHNSHFHRRLRKLVRAFPVEGE